MCYRDPWEMVESVKYGEIEEMSWIIPPWGGGAELVKSLKYGQIGEMGRNIPLWTAPLVNSEICRNWGNGPDNSFLGHNPGKW